MYKKMFLFYLLIVVLLLSSIETAFAQNDLHGNSSEVTLIFPGGIGASYYLHGQFIGETSIKEPVKNLSVQVPIFPRIQLTAIPANHEYLDGGLDPVSAALIFNNGRISIEKEKDRSSFTVKKAGWHTFSITPQFKRKEKNP